ncbi:phage replisome organizer N-terminal domain-containing protein [Aerococcus sanguinicola]|uniref:DnaD domain protein n=1 Tax=Aerococcus sanguinicola TaxID=119206 RepID=A0A0X8F9U8_9LACT|nr:phage replisome organizer N-terminal domain-containing protein [Aerococcus sanguinicola]AMB93274.1 hypothetical protein AWM72_00060 [Aerococcus sanguinicola]
MAKKYFWLKLKDDFFEQKEIKMLRRVAGGDTYTIIYLKMLLLSLSNEGRIYYDGIAENMVEEIALSIDEDSDNVQITFNYLISKGLIIFEDEDEVELTNIASMIGSETDSARRMRQLRKKKTLQRHFEASQCDNQVTGPLRGGDGEIEIELEKDIEKELEQDTEKNLDVVGQSAIDYYQENYGMLSPIMIQDIQHWVKDTSDELMLYAFEQAIGTRNPFKYAMGVMKNLAKQGITTVEDAKASSVEYRRNEEKKQKGEPEINEKLGW